MERQSVGWGLYLAIMYAVASSRLQHGCSVPWPLSPAANGRAGSCPWPTGWSGQGCWLGTAGCGAIRARARWLMPDVPTVVGSVFGLIIGVGGAVTATGNAPGHRHPRLHGVSLSRGTVVAVRAAVAGLGRRRRGHLVVALDPRSGRRLRTGFADVGAGGGRHPRGRSSWRLAASAQSCLSCSGSPLTARTP